MNLHSLDPAALLLLHDESLGESSLEKDAYDAVLLDAALAYHAALAYPANEAILRASDIADIAAAYAIGILKFRPFAVGNERAAFLAMGLFLYLNDWRLNAPNDDAARVIWLASAGEIGESELANWIRQSL
jgi:death on curing protein